MIPVELTIRIPKDRGNLYEVIHYPAGEIQTRLTDAGMLACIKSDTLIIEANPVPDIMELAQLLDAATALGRFSRRVLHVPYLPYSRADRRFTKGDTFGLKVFMKLVAAMGFDEIKTFDVHSPIAEVEANFFGVKFENIDPVNDEDQIAPVIRYIGNRAPLCLVVPDKGSISRYNLGKYGKPVLQGDKIRDPKTGKLSRFIIAPNIRNYDAALIVDDICDGGGTFIGLGKAIKEITPNIALYLYTSHGIYSQGEENLRSVFREIFHSASGFYNGNGTIKEVIS